MRGLHEVCINFVPALSVSFFTYTCNPQEASNVSYGFDEEVRRKKQKLNKGSALKKGISFGKKTTLGAHQARKGSDVSRVSEQPEGPPIEHFLEPQASGGPSKALLTAPQASSVRDPVAMLPTEDPTLALAAHHTELSLGLGEDAAVDARQIARVHHQAH